MEFLWRPFQLPNCSAPQHQRVLPCQVVSSPSKMVSKYRLGAPFWNALERISAFDRTATRQSPRDSPPQAWCLDPLFLCFLIGNRGLAPLTCFLKGGNGTCWLSLFKTEFGSRQKQIYFRSSKCQHNLYQNPHLLNWKAIWTKDFVSWQHACLLKEISSMGTAWLGPWI